MDVLRTKPCFDIMSFVRLGSLRIDGIRWDLLTGTGKERGTCDLAVMVSFSHRQDADHRGTPIFSSSSIRISSSAGLLRQSRLHVR